MAGQKYRIPQKELGKGNIFPTPVDFFGGFLFDPWPKHHSLGTSSTLLPPATLPGFGAESCGRGGLIFWTRLVVLGDSQVVFGFFDGFLMFLCSASWVCGACGVCLIVIMV